MQQRSVFLSTLLLILASAPARAGERAIYSAATQRIERSYLRIDQLDLELAFRQAAEAAEDAVPWLLVEVREDGPRLEVLLSHGDLGLFATVVHPPQPMSDDPLADLVTSLEHLEDAITGLEEQGRAELPEDLDLPVELLRGVSRALDRHSVVLAGERLSSFNERIKGRLVGIGCRINLEEGELVIREVFPDGPADKGGLRPGDRIRRIDEVSTLGFLLDDAVDRIRGEKGTPVKLEIERPGATDALLELDFLRDEVRIPNVSWSRTDDDTGLIHIDHFSQQTARLLERALRDLSEQPGLKGYVLDLRGNSGGSMLQAAKTVDLFVDQGLILRTGGRDFARVHGLVREVQAWPPDPESDVPDAARELPLVVLMDRNSASASEIVAGSLSLLGRAVLIGTRSHGKGTVQQPFLLRDADEHGHGEVKLKLTIAEYHLAQDTPVESSVGLTPDLSTIDVRLGEGRVVLPATVSDGDALGLVVEGPGWRPGGQEEDRGDLLLGLAQQIVANTTGPERIDALASAARVMARARQVEEQRLVDAMAARGVDWSPDDLCESPCALPRVEVELEPLGPAVAGETVTLEARVRNLGPGPLYRVMVRLLASNTRLPWHDLAIPIGFVPPGEEARAQVDVAIPMYPADRQDHVSLTLEADRRPLVGLDPVLLALQGASPPPVRLHLAGLQLGEGELDGGVPVQLAVGVENLGTQELTGVQLRPLHLQDRRLEPLEREHMIDRVPPGQTVQTTLGFAWSGEALPTQPTVMELEVAAERYGELLEARLPMDWGPSHMAELAAPRIAGEVPVAAPAGSLGVRLRAQDDDGVQSLTAWWRGDKVAWRSGQGEELGLDLDLELYEGTSTLVVDVVDQQGVKQRRRWYVRGMAEEDATASP